MAVRHRGHGMDDHGLKSFSQSLKESGLYPLTSRGVTTLQVNVGALCNQSCLHCHVDAGPRRSEVMPKRVMESCLRVVDECDIPVVDITGGAPEMNPDYRWFIEECVRLGSRVKTRTNLTVLVEDGFEDMPEFFARNRVEVIASLPYYTERTTDRMRGPGTFRASLDALKRLNRAGYGSGGNGLVLNLAYNPCGAYLPPSQASIERDFRRELEGRFGIRFTNLFTITNMPLGRFRDFLEGSGNMRSYMERLVGLFNPAAAANVMCRETLSVGWDGTLFDCDFNQMLGLVCAHGAPSHIDDLDRETLDCRTIVTGMHCYGCTAGAGSSCGGEVA